MLHDIANKKLNILIAHNYYQISGGEDSVVRNEMNLLKKRGHVVYLYTRNNSEINDMKGIKKILLPLITIFNPRTYREIRKKIIENNIDIVHVHNTLFFISPSIYYAAKSLKIPVVQTVHNFRLLCPGATFYREGRICEECVSKGLFHAVKNKCYRNSFVQTFICSLSGIIHRKFGIYKDINYICLTEFNKEKLLNYKQISPQNVYIKPNFIEKTEGVSLVKEREHQYVFAGRIDETKGIKILLNAWNMLKQKNVLPKLIICGTGPLEKWCKDFIKKHKLYNVTLLGFIENQEVKKIISRSKGLILPTQWYEGFPVSIIEALSVGTPVIGAKIGNTGSIILDNVTGKKFDSYNPEELCNVISELELEYKFNYYTIQEVFNSTYSDEKNYEILMSIYQDVMEKNR